MSQSGLFFSTLREKSGGDEGLFIKSAVSDNPAGHQQSLQK